MDDLLDEIGNDDISRLIRKEELREDQKAEVYDFPEPPVPEPPLDGICIPGDIDGDPEPFPWPEPPLDGEISGLIDIEFPYESNDVDA